jgi:hypothetical protein
MKNVLYSNLASVHSNAAKPWHETVAKILNIKDLDSWHEVKPIDLRKAGGSY